MITHTSKTRESSAAGSKIAGSGRSRDVLSAHVFRVKASHSASFTTKMPSSGTHTFVLKDENGSGKRGIVSRSLLGKAGSIIVLSPAPERSRHMATVERALAKQHWKQDWLDLRIDSLGAMRKLLQVRRHGKLSDLDASK